MLIVTAGRTGPNRSVRFGGDLSLDERGRRDMASLAASARDVGVVISGPERATRESSELLGAVHSVDDRLATLDVGDWSGRIPEEIDPDDLRAWFTDPSARPHGGEAIVEFVERIHRWRSAVDPTPGACVVAMPVAQALLTADATQYFSVEVRPATVY